MDTTGTDARGLVARLWREAQHNPEATPPIEIPDPPTRAHVRHSAELAYLNRRWILEVTPPPKEASGFVDKVRASFKAILQRLLLSTLQRYLLEERDFLANLVRFGNQLAERGDVLLDELRTLGDRLREQDARIRDELGRLAERDDTLHRALEARIEALERRHEG